MTSPPDRLGHSVTSPGTYASRRCRLLMSRQGSPPSRVAVPASARSRPSRIRRVVDLPAPLGPRKPCTSPVSTVRSRPSSARVRPKFLTSPDTEIAAVMTPKLHRFHKVLNIKNPINWCDLRRRGDDALVTEVAPPTSASDRDGDAVASYVERFAGVLTASGMPRMPSRVFVALLVTDSGRLTAAELAET